MQNTRLARPLLVAVAALLLVGVAVPQPVSAATAPATCYRYDPAVGTPMPFGCSSLPCQKLGPQVNHVCKIVVKAVDNAAGGGWIAVPPANVPCSATATVTTSPPSATYSIDCPPPPPPDACSTVTVTAKVNAGVAVVTGVAECVGFAPATCTTTSACTETQAGAGSVPFACRWTIQGAGDADVVCTYT